MAVILPIYTARGYVIDVKVEKQFLNHQLMLEEIKVVVNPYRHRVKLARVMDFVGFNQEIPSKRIKGILKNVYSYIPELRNHKVANIYTAFRPCPPDEIPIIGPIPRYERVIVATGHCRFRLTFSALTAQIVRNILSDDGTYQDSDIFSPNRFLE